MSTYRPFSSTAYVQRGRGLGSLFRSIIKIASPIVRKGVSAIAKVGKSQVMRSIANDLKNTAIQTGLELASTAIKPSERNPEELKNVVKRGVTRAREQIGNRLKETSSRFSSQPKQKKPRRRKRYADRGDLFE